MSLVARLARPELLSLHAAEPSLAPSGWLRLHANENPYSDPDARDPDVRRYPEASPTTVEATLAELYGVRPSEVVATRGSDEAIDLLVRAFCVAGRDGVLISPPTFGMYEAAARIQGAQVVRCPTSRDNGFVVETPALTAASRANTKLVFLCSPNNPTGSSIARTTVEAVLEHFRDSAIVVLDEAYVEFSQEPSFVCRIGDFENLVVLRTLSKAHGLAGVRCGAAIANPAIAALLRRIRPPYSLTSAAVAEVATLVTPERLGRTRDVLRRIVAERVRMQSALQAIPLVRQVWPSDANFLLVACADVSAVIERATRARILLRDFRSTPGLEDCVRISIGTPEDHSRLFAALEET